MSASLQGHHLRDGRLLEDVAAASGAVIVTCWAALLALESRKSGDWIPNIWSYNQAVVLAVIFASYVIGWKHHLLGAALGILGTVTFFAVGFADTKMLPPAPALLLSTPALLYLLAWGLNPHRRQSDADPNA